MATAHREPLGTAEAASPLARVSLVVLVAVALLVIGAGLLLYAAWSGRHGHPRTPAPSSARPLRRPLAGFGEIGATVTDSAGRTRRWCLLAALTPRQHERGLMAVRDQTLRGHDGMVFIFAQERQIGFWMRNTPMPLSVAYHDGRGRFVSMADMEPCIDRATCPVYRPARSYRFAVEVVRGGLDHLGIEPGAVLRPGGGCASPSPR